MSHFALILTLAALFTGGILVFNLYADTGRAQDRLDDYQFQQLARDAAVTGLNLTVRRLADDAAPGTWTSGTTYGFDETTYDSGAFEVTVTPVGNPVGDTVDVVAIGRNGGREHVLDARYVRAFADGGIPPAFRNVITTDNYIQLTGNVHIRSVNPHLNASIHTNGNLTTQGNAFRVDGYGTYTGTIDSRNPTNFVPNVDWNGDDPNAFWADSVHIPLIDFDQLRAAAGSSGAIFGGELFGGELVVNGNTMPVIDFTNPASWPEGWQTSAPYNCTPGPCGTADNPFIMVIEGQLSLLNNIEILGYGIIIATGDIEISPGGAGGGVSAPLSANLETQVMLATLGNMDLQGNPCLGRGPTGQGTDNQNCPSANGQYTHGLTLYAGGSQGITSQGTPYMVGGIITPRTAFGGSGTPSVHYASPSETIIDPGFNYIIPIGPVLISYSEW